MLKKAGVDGVKKNLNADVSCVLDILWLKFLTRGGPRDKERTAQNKLCKSMEEYLRLWHAFIHHLSFFMKTLNSTLEYAKLFIFFEKIAVIFCVMLSMQRTVSTHAYAQQTGQRDNGTRSGLRDFQQRTRDFFEGRRREEWEWEMEMGM